MPMTHEQKTVLDILVDNTHGFMTPGFVDLVNKAFGVDFECQRTRANPDSPKGLTFDNGKKVGVGLSALDIACLLCSALRVSYEEKFGRGSQVIACVTALRGHLQ